MQELFNKHLPRRHHHVCFLSGAIVVLKCFWSLQKVDAPDVCAEARRVDRLFAAVAKAGRGEHGREETPISLP